MIDLLRNERAFLSVIRKNQPVRAVDVSVPERLKGLQAAL
jgi:hypothetical protein